MRAHGQIAPSPTAMEPSGTTRSGSNFSSVPRPSQVGQAPAGALNENSRGSISSIVKPETGHAKRCENTTRSWVSFFDLLAPSVSAFDSGLSANSMSAMPSASPSAVSKAVGEARRDALAHDEAVHDDVDVVLVLLVELRRVGISWKAPLILTRWKPFFCHSASSLRYSPLRPRTTGASR